MESPAFIQSYLSTLSVLCEQHQVESLYIFGSAITKQFNALSDLDFVVQFGHIVPEDYADNYFDFREALSRLFERKIDLVESQTLKNPYFKQVVDNSKILICARRSGAQVVA